MARQTNSVNRMCARLDDRTIPSVSPYVFAGNLFLRGDANPDAMIITNTGPGHFDVINNGIPIGSFNNITQGVFVNLGRGNNSVVTYLTNGGLGNGLYITTSAGNDLVQILAAGNGAAFAATNIIVTTGGGADNVFFGDGLTNLTLNSRVFASTGGGNDTVTLTGRTTTGQFYALTTSGDDCVRYRGTASYLFADLGLGDDILAFGVAASTILPTHYILGGDGINQYGGTPGLNVSLANPNVVIGFVPVYFDGLEC